LFQAGYYYYYYYYYYSPLELVLLGAGTAGLCSNTLGCVAVLLHLVGWIIYSVSAVMAALSLLPVFKKGSAAAGCCGLVNSSNAAVALSLNDGC
jgi:hypothetical protein